MKIAQETSNVDHSGVKLEEGVDAQSGGPPSEPDVNACGSEQELSDEAVDEDDDDTAVSLEPMLTDESKQTGEDDSGHHHQTSTSQGNSSSAAAGPPVFSSSFTSAADLQVYKCSECPYESYHLAALTSHQKIHKLYQCDVCQMKFSHAANMRRHRMRHTGFKPFECRVCLKRFFRKDHLMEHMITHSKQLPFQCPMCDKSFNRQVYFKAHLQADHWNLPGDKVCHLCGHKAATIKGAKLHYTTRHARAANTVNSSSPANSARALADAAELSQNLLQNTVTRSSLMSARLERGPTLLNRDTSSPNGADGNSDGDASSCFASLASLAAGAESMAGTVSSSQLLMHNSPQSSSTLLNDALSRLVMPSLSLGGATPRDLNGLTPSNYCDLVSASGLGPGSIAQPSSTSSSPSSSRSRVLTPSRSNRLLTSAVSVRGRRNSGRGVTSGPGFAHQDTNSLAIKTEPPDEESSDGTEGEERSILPDKEGPRSPDHPDAQARAPSRTAGSSSTSSRSHSETCSPNSTLDVVRMAANGSPTMVAAFASASALHRQVSVGDVTITPLGAALACVHCGIVFPDQTLYFLHKGVHSENNPWKCNICGEPCRDKYDFNTHILSKAHQ